MSNLKELIDRLYDEVMTQQDPDEDQMPQIEELANEDLDAERLRQILSQMQEVLQKEDLSGLQATAPLNADETTKLMLQWENLNSSIEGLRRHMKDLEADIARMQPWGDFDVVKLEQLQQRDCHVRFWTMPIAAFAAQASEAWVVNHQATLISEDAANAFFITISLGNEKPQMPAQASEMEICPCPVSTLIMLQTRDKDSLKRVMTLQGDFALAHYAELLETLRTILPKGAALPQRKHAQNLRARLRRLFRK